ncbi:MAG: hypothetical protein GYA61_07510 [Spirochaetales bacterium]|nr:hypothetical protein [Spirochaetales bacterium]
MKRKFFLFFLFLISFLITLFPIHFVSAENKLTFAVFFNNFTGEFAPNEVKLATDNLYIYLKSKYNIELVDYGLSSRAYALELMRKDNLKCYAEFSGKTIGINYSNSKYKIDLSINLIFDSTKTDQIDFEKTKNYEGEESYTIGESKSFTLSKAFIDIFSENIDKIKEILSQ